MWEMPVFLETYWLPGVRHSVYTGVMTRLLLKLAILPETSSLFQRSVHNLYYMGRQLHRKELSGIQQWEGLTQWWSGWFPYQWEFHTSKFPYQGCEAVLLSLDGNLHQNLLVQAAPETKLPLKCHVRGSFLYLNQRERQWARWKGAWKQQTQRKRQCLLVMRLWPSPDVPLTCLGCDQAAKQWEKKIPTFSQGGLLENLLTNRVRSISTAILKLPSHHSNVFKIVSLLGYCLGGLTIETWALSPLQKPHNVPQVLWIELCTPCQIHTSTP